MPSIEDIEDEDYVKLSIMAKIVLQTMLWGRKKKKSIVYWELPQIQRHIRPPKPVMCKALGELMAGGFIKEIEGYGGNSYYLNGWKVNELEAKLERINWEEEKYGKCK